MSKTPGKTTPNKPGGTFNSLASSDDVNLQHLAFDNSLQPNLISTVSDGNIVMANTAACKLLGYSKRAIQTKSRSTIFAKNETSFKKMLKQRTSEGSSSALVTAIKKNGKHFPCEITSAVFTDADGIKKAITTLTDMSERIREQKNIDTQKEKEVASDIKLAKSKQKKIDIRKDEIVSNNIVIAQSKQKTIDARKDKIVASNIVMAQAASDARFAEHAEWKKYIGKTLYDVMWDWDIVTGEIYIGDSAEEVFGYKIHNNKIDFAILILCLSPDEKDAIEKRLETALASDEKIWDDAFMFKRHTGSMASTICRASIIRNDQGKAIRLIGAIQDVTELQELEKKLDDQYAVKWERSITSSLAAKLSFDGIWDWNILTNEFVLGEGFQELFGYPINNSTNLAFRWSDYLHPDDKNDVEKGLQDAIESSATHWEQACRFIRADGSIAEVFSRASILRHADGKAYRIIGAMHDISRQKILEEKLAREIKIKEMQIAEASEEAKDAERSDIGKELHDNVNQLLGASRLYLDMAKSGGMSSAKYLSRSSEYILTAIEEIRKLTKGMTTDIIKNLGLCEAITNVTRDTMEVNPVKISCELKSFIEDSVTNKFKLNVFRIVQEQMNNILKHAQATEVVISLSQNKKSIILSISDNGIGFDTEKKQEGIGVDNIKSRAASYNGTADFVSESGHGCVITVTFPVTEELLSKTASVAS